MTDRKLISDPVTLEKPIERGEETIATLQLRRPTAGELRGLNLNNLLNLDVDAITVVLPRISVPTVTRAEALELDPADLVALAAELSDFLVPAAMKPDPEPATSKKPWPTSH